MTMNSGIDELDSHGCGSQQHHQGFRLNWVLEDTDKWISISAIFKETLRVTGSITQPESVLASEDLVKLASIHLEHVTLHDNITTETNVHTPTPLTSHTKHTRPCTPPSTGPELRSRSSKGNQPPG